MVKEKALVKICHFCVTGYLRKTLVHIKGKHKRNIRVCIPIGHAGTYLASTGQSSGIREWDKSLHVNLSGWWINVQVRMLHLKIVSCILQFLHVYTCL